MADQQDELEQVKSTDLNPALMARESVAKKTWFFKRGDGMIFPCEEKEAWDICNNRSEWKRRDFSLIGVSDGTTYQKIVKESIHTAKRLEPEIETMSAELERYERAEQKLLVDEAVDMEGDPTDAINEGNKQKVIRLRNIIERLEKNLEAKNKEYRDAVGGLVKRATEAELEVARGHIEWPSEMNIITPDASEKERQRILKVMNKN